jgi:hypothetical protein
VLADDLEHLPRGQDRQDPAGQKPEQEETGEAADHGASVEHRAEAAQFNTG